MICCKSNADWDALTNLNLTEIPFFSAWFVCIYDCQTAHIHIITLCCCLAKVILAWLRWPELNTNMFLCAGWRAETKREEGGQTGRLLIISHNPVKLSFRDKLNLHRLARCETLLIALMISRRHLPCTDSSPTAKQNLFRNSLAVISFLCMSPRLLLCAPWPDVFQAIWAIQKWERCIHPPRSFAAAVQELGLNVCKRSEKAGERRLNVWNVNVSGPGIPATCSQQKWVCGLKQQSSILDFGFRQNVTSYNMIFFFFHA